MLLARSRYVLLAAALLGLIAALVGAPIQRVLVPSRLDFSDPHAESGQVESELAAAAHTGLPGAVVILLALHPSPIAAGPGKGGPAGAGSGQGGSAIGGAAHAAIVRLNRILTHQSGVASVYSPLSAAGDRLVSPDRRYAGFILTLRAMSAPAIQRTLGALQRRFAHQPDVLLGGTELAYKEASDQGKADLLHSELLAFPLLLIAALFIFRGLIAALLPLITGAFALALTFALMRLVNAAIPLSNFALNLVTGLTLALAIDYSLFIVSRFREGLAEGRTVRGSVELALATAGRTVILSALTIAGTVASLLLFPQRFLYSMGICGLLVAACAALTAVTVLPALLMVLGERVNALSLSLPGPLTRAGGAAGSGARMPAGSGVVWGRLGEWVTSRPRRAALLGAIVLLGAAAPSLSARFVAFNASMLPAGTSTRQVADRVRGQFPQFGSIDTVAVRAPAGADRRLTALLLKLTQLPGAAGAGLPQYLGHSLWTIELEGTAAEDSAGARALVRKARGLSRPSLSLKVGGVTATSIDKLASLQRQIPGVLGIIALATLALVFLLTGSLLLPIKALIINLLTISGAFGLLVLIFQDGYLHGMLGFSTQPGLEATQPVLLFVIAFGLSTDYGIFLLARIVEGHQQGLSTRQATVLGMQRTGSLISAAALLFCIAIGALATSPLILVKLLGLGAAFAVILDATFARALLVPALIVMFGRLNWWAPPPLRRLHRRIGPAFEDRHPTLGSSAPSWTASPSSQPSAPS